MQVKKQVMVDIKKRLADALGKVHMELNQNRREINKLAERQCILKKEVKEFYKLIRSLPKD
jgi:2-hydroxy-3-keto-5-methylthiopentenyl-1-phosphate phosphatase